MTNYEVILQESFQERDFYDLGFFPYHEERCEDLGLPFSVDSLGNVEGAKKLAELYTGDFILLLLAVGEEGTLYPVGLATGYPRVDEFEFIYSENR